ncbi:MAG: polysaccharide biosynthesis C-terminal domain-containing protein [Myxococcota bacterium]
MSGAADAEERLARDLAFLRRGTLINVIGFGARNVAPALNIALAALCPPELFGVYVSAQLFALTFSKLVTAGLDRGLMRHVAARVAGGEGAPAESAEEAIGAALRRVLLLAVLSVGIALLALGPPMGALWPERMGDRGFVLLVLLGIPGYGVMQLLAGAFDGLRRPEVRELLVYGLVGALAPLLGILSRLAGLPDWGVAASLPLATGLGAIGLFVLTRRAFPGLRPLRAGPLPAGMWAFSLPLGFADLVTGLMLRIDVWMVLALLDAPRAAVYGLMAMLVAGTRSIRQSYDQVIVPVVATLRPGEDGPALRSVHGYAVHLTTCIQLAIGVLLLFFPVELISLAGEAYVVQPETLGVLLLGNLVTGLLGMSGAILQGFGASRPFLLANLVAIAVNATLNLALIPRLGIVGAGLATGAAKHRKSRGFRAAL